LIATVTEVCVSDEDALVVLLATCSLTELMIVASTHAAAAVPRIQRIIRKCASDCPESSSVRALSELNVQQKPSKTTFSARSAVETSRPFRLSAS
jgi:hypothetical protein